MHYATPIDNHESSSRAHPVMAFLHANKHIFLSSPELLQRTLKYLSAFLPAPKVEKKKILLPQSHGFLLVQEKDIVFLEADGSYTQVTLRDGEKVLVSHALRDFVSLLSPTYFERIHKSYIINLSYLKSYSRLQGGIVKMEDGTELLVSRRRLPAFLEKMSRITLSFS